MIDGKVKRASQGKLFNLIELLKDKEINTVYIADATISIQGLIMDLLEPSLKKTHLKEHGTLEGYTPFKRLVQFIPGMRDDNNKFVGSSVTSIIGLNEALERYNENKKNDKVYRID